MSDDEYYDDDNGNDPEDYCDEYAMEEEEEKHDSSATPSKMFFGQSQVYRLVPDYLFLNEIRTHIKGLQDSLGISSGKALWLIQKLNYNEKLYNNLSSKLIDDLYDTSHHVKESKNKKVQKECLLCGDDTGACSLECGHLFCSSCWEQYLTSGIKQGVEFGLVKKCPMDKCKQFVDIEFFKNYLSDANYKLFEKFLVQDFIAKNKTAIECPGKACNNIIVLNSYKGSITSYEDVQFNVCCSCSFAFCSLCREEAHRPLSCSKFKEWMNLIGGKNSDEIDSLWIKLNTKKCPKCKIDIEKNQGCMHMTCKKCTHQFCWLCFGDWNNHQDCNKFQAIVEKEISQVKKESTEQLNRYNFFSERFIQHRKSIQFAIKKKKTIETKCAEIDKLLKEKISFDYLQNAVLTIIECRRAVTYTYGVGYYIEEKKRALLEFLQKELESNLEKLDNKTDQILMDYYEKAFQMMNTDYYVFERDVKSLTLTLNKYFTNMIDSFEKDMPELSKQASLTEAKQKQLQLQKQKSNKGKAGVTTRSGTNKDKDEQFESLPTWKCDFCAVENDHDYVICESCFKSR